MVKSASQLHNLQHQAEQLLLHKFCPAAVLVNGEGDILYINGRTLNVRRLTNQSTQLFKLIPGDVGRPLSDIVNELHYPGLQADAQAVLHSLVFSEKQIAARDGRWYKVRIMPCRTLENVIDGVVIPFSDITEAKTLEAELRSRQHRSTENEAKK